MGVFRVPPNYALFNDQSVKQIAIVVKIDGVPIISNGPVYTRILYGDPGVDYGDAGLVYGGLRKLTGAEAPMELLSLDGSSLSINQKIEPEQGKGSVSLLTLAFIDKDGYMTELCSPGVIIPDIMGREVTVYLGYQEISYPGDYFQIFRGYVSGVNQQGGLVILQMSDPNLRKRQQIARQAKTILTSPVSDSTLTFPVASNGGFYSGVIGPDLTDDPAITMYIKVEEEYIEVPYSGGLSGSTTIFGVSGGRGARGTTAVAHPSGADVSNAIQIEDTAINMALKIMLSGWNGPWLENVTAYSFLQTTDPILGDVPGAIVLPNNVNALADYGLVEGDYVYITGGVNDGVSGPIIRFAPLFGQEARIIVIDAAVALEYPAVGTLSFRSQFDTYPVEIGLKMTPKDVDVARHLYYRNTFLNQPENAYRFFLTSQQSGKDFIDMQIYLPLGAYGLTRNGRVSMGLSRPPIADQQLQVLSEDNVIDPVNSNPTRSLNNRKFFNEIQFNYDYTDDGTATSVLRTIDTDSLNVIGMTQNLPINSLGGRTDLGITPFFEKRTQLLLSRFKNAAVQIFLTVNYGKANQIEAGDIVAVTDNGGLQIPNWATGSRTLGTQLFEVIERALDIKMGRAKLTLIAGLGAQASDRYATISPSSDIVAGSTTTSLNIVDSYGAVYPGDEQRKWADYIGQQILVHSQDYTVQEETTLLGFDPADRYKMFVSGLSFAPPAGYVIDVPNYPTSVDPTVNQVYKLIHAFTDPSVLVTAGTSQTVFDVGAGDVGKFFVGCFVRVHDANYTIDSGNVDIAVTDITGNTITVDTALGFTPSAGQLVELIGFADQGGAYRYV